MILLDTVPYTLLYIIYIIMYIYMYALHGVLPSFAFACAVDSENVGAVPRPRHLANQCN